MIFLDKCITKVVNNSTPFTVPDSIDIKCIVPVGSSAVIRAKSKMGDSHTVDGVYASAGLTRFPGEMIYGAFSEVTVTTGTCLVYYTENSERL